MKNYAEIFYKTYEESFKKQQKTTKKDIIFLVLAFFSSLFVCLAIVVFVNILITKNNNETSIFKVITTSKYPLWIFIIAATIVTYVIFRIRKQVKKSNFYGQKTKEFATTVLLDDFMSILGKSFTFDSNFFKENLKKKMEELSWYNDNEEDAPLVPGFFLDEERYFREPITSISTNEVYYIVSWENKKTGFFIEAVKMRGRMDTVEFFLLA